MNNNISATDSKGLNNISSKINDQMGSQRVNISKWGTPPPGYIPGIGRGAIPILTRSDIGEARNFVDPLLNTNNNRNQSFNKNKDKDSTKKEEEEDYNKPYDNWNGTESGLFKQENLDDEDEEADNVYDQVERYLEEKRAKQRNSTNKKVIDEFQKNNNSIKGMFADLKKDLSSVQKHEWMNIPEIENFTIKKKKVERFSAVPDHVIQSGLSDSRLLNSIQVSNKAGSGTITSIQNLDDVSQAKSSVLSIAMDKLSGNGNKSIFNSGNSGNEGNNRYFNDSKGTTSVNPIGYLTEVTGINVKNNSENNDFKKARKILNAVIESDIVSVSGYVGLARLEELEGKISKAREVITQAVEKITDSEDIWLEAARLHSSNQARVFLQKGLSNLPESSKLWIAYADLETGIYDKIKIYEQALNQVSFSEEIWKKLINLVDDEKAKIYLSKAVECVPKSTDLWLAYAKLEDYKAAKDILNKARIAIPNNLCIWTTAIRLEETNFLMTCDYEDIEKLKSKKKEMLGLIRNILNKAHRSLAKHGVIPSREVYLSEAQICERSNCLVCCEAIISETISRDKELDSNDRIDLWKVLIDKAIADKSYNTPKFIYEQLMLMEGSFNLSLWLKFLELEKLYGSEEAQEKTYLKGIEEASELEMTWLEYVKFIVSTQKNISKAISVLIKAKDKIRFHENIVIEIMNLYMEKTYKEMFISKLIDLIPSYKDVIKKPESLDSLLLSELDCNNIRKIDDNIFLNDSNSIAENGNIIKARKELVDYITNHNGDYYFNDNEDSLLSKLKNKSFSNKIVMKLIQLERFAKNYNEVHRLSDVVIKEYQLIDKYNIKENNSLVNSYDYLKKILLIKAQVYTENNNKDFGKAILTYEKAIKDHKEYVNYYIEESRLLIDKNYIDKARAILQKGKEVLSINSTKLYIEEIKLELKQRNYKQAKLVLSLALNKYPESGELKAMEIAIEEITTRESKAARIYEELPNNQYIILSIGKIWFNVNKKIEESIKWFEKVVRLNKNFGDGWIYLYIACDASVNRKNNYKVVSESNNSNGNGLNKSTLNNFVLKEIERRCLEANPNQGEIWNHIRKNPHNWFKPSNLILKLALDKKEEILNYLP